MLIVALGATSAACVVPRQVLASSDDLADYRAFRLAEHPGRRLFEAQRYLERHPRGAWADEVRAAFDAEEAAWFEAAKVSRARAREYLVDLPTGPHVEAARNLMLLFDEHQDDADTLILLADARRTWATLDHEAERRRKVTETVLQEVAALLEPSTWGARLEGAPPALAGVLRGEVPHTWGGATHAQRSDDLFFVVPTPEGAHASVVELDFQLWMENGGVAEGVVHGKDLFVRWGEALLTQILDAARPGDRARAAAAVTEVLAGALEAALPAARCQVALQPGELLARACPGWTVSIRMGPGPGTEDSIAVRGDAKRVVRTP